MSRLDGADAERSARYGQSQNGVVATSLRSTLQRSSHVVDPPARWANRRSVPRGSSPMRMQPGAPLRMYARNDRSLGRASARRFSALASLAPNSPRRRVPCSVALRFAPDRFPTIREPTGGPMCVRWVEPISFPEPSTLSLFRTDRLVHNNFLATSEPTMDQLSISLPLALSVQLAEFPRSSTADDFLMASLATADGVASSLCSGDAEWGVRIAISANPARSVPTATPRHVTRTAAHDGCARPPQPPALPAAASRIRRPRLRSVSDSQVARALIPSQSSSPRYENRTLTTYHLYIIQLHTQNNLYRTPLCCFCSRKRKRRFSLFFRSYHLFSI